MHRRQLLRFAGTTAVAGFAAGCIDDGERSSSSDDAAKPDEGTKDSERNETIDGNATSTDGNGDGSDEDQKSNEEDDSAVESDDENESSVDEPGTEQSEDDDPDDDSTGENDGDGETKESDDEPADAENDGEAEIWYSFSTAEATTFDRSVTAFTEEFPGTIRSNNISELRERTADAILDADGPELFVWSHDLVGEYARRGLLSEQGDRLSIDLDVEFGSAADAGRFGGSTFGLPFAGETTTLIYNREYVGSAPATFEEVVEIAADCHDPDDDVYGFTWPMDAYYVSAMVHGFGGYYYDDETGALGLTEDETIAGLEYILDTVWEFMPSRIDRLAQEDVFLDGRAPFLVAGPWTLWDLENEGIEYGVAPWPTAEGHTPSPYTSIHLMYFAAGMDDDDERADTARAFAEWYTTDAESSERLANEHGLAPVHRTFEEGESRHHAITDEMGGFAAALEQGTPMPTRAEFDAVWAPLEEEWHEAIRGNKSVAAAMTDAESRIRSDW